MPGLKIQLDALTKEHWSPADRTNAGIVTDFVQLIMNDHHFETIQKEYGDHPYVQHNRLIPDGISGIIGYIKEFARRFPEFTYDVRHIYVDGEFVSLHSHATITPKHRGDDNKGYNIVDTWKVVDGKLVEHWDAVQPLDWFSRLYALFIGGRIRNGNGVF